MRKIRRLRRKRNKKQIHLIIGGTLALLFVFTAGYAAFGTNISITAKGNVKDYKRTLATTYIANLKNNGDTTLIDDGTDDHNIRYSGKPVNNYVCLKNEKPCQDENLYRIIGVFNNIKTNENKTGETRIKLVKATNIGRHYWDTDENYAYGNSNWARPATLNITLQALSVASNSLIDSAVWNLGGINSTEITSSEAYKLERGTTTDLLNAPATWTGKVALMYPSDYGYASSMCYYNKQIRSSTGDDYAQDICKNTNWIFGNQSTQCVEWLLTPYSKTADNAFGIQIWGNLLINQVKVYSNAVRPSVFLKSNVNIIENGNNGSEEKPYLLELEN